MQHEQEMKSAKVFYINHVDDLKPLDQPAVYLVLLKFLQRDLEKFHH